MWSAGIGPMSPAAMVMDPAADATVWQMFASSGLNGTSGRSAAKNPIEMAAERTLPPCAQPALSPKLTFMALTTNPTKTPASTARALRGSASRDTIAPPAELWRVRFFRDEENKSRARITTWSVPLTPRRDRLPLARSVLCQAKFPRGDLGATDHSPGRVAHHDRLVEDAETRASRT